MFFLQKRMICICIVVGCEVNCRPLKQLNIGFVGLFRLNFVRDKSVLIKASSVQPSHSKQVLLNKE
jgi:hypothetical protein